MGTKDSQEKKKSQESAPPFMSSAPAANKRNLNESYQHTIQLAKRNYGFLIDPTNQEGLPAYQVLTYSLWMDILRFFHNENDQTPRDAKTLLSLSRVCRGTRYMLERESSHLPVQLTGKAFSFYQKHANTKDSIAAQKEFCQALMSLDIAALQRAIPKLPQRTPCFDYSTSSSSSDKSLSVAYTLVTTMRYNVNGTLPRFLPAFDRLVELGWVDVDADPFIFYATQLKVNNPKDRIPLLEELHKRNCNLDNGSLLSGLTPLHLCVKNYDHVTAAWLLDHGADATNRRLWRTYGSNFTIDANACDSLQAVFMELCQRNAKVPDNLKELIMVFKKRDLPVPIVSDQ